VLDELAAAGLRVHQLPELRRFGARYAPVVPALVRHLEQIEDLGVREELARVLAVPWARAAALRPLIGVFRRTPNSPPATKAALAAAIEALADDAVEDELVELARTTSHGNARELIVMALAKLSNPALIDVLAQLLSDRGVGGHALVALARLVARHRTPVELALVKPFLRDGRAWVRRETKDLLAVLETLPRG
jgi:HEAT repeat protein